MGGIVSLSLGLILASIAVLIMGGDLFFKWKDHRDSKL